MRKALVIGPVWATKRLSQFPGGALLEVQTDDGSERFIALDQLGCGPGDEVLICQGSAVSRHLPGDPPLDALVVGVIDESTRATTGATPLGKAHQ